MNVFLTCVLAYVLLAVLYRFAVMLLLRSAIEERFAMSEKQLEQLVNKGECKPESFTHEYLLNICSARHRLGSMNISDFLHFMLMAKMPKDPMERLKKFQAEANASELKLHKDLCRHTGLCLAINSPVYFTVACSGIVVYVLLKQNEEARVRRRAEAFVSAEACPA